MDHNMPSFSEFFKALWNYEPFPWQAMLAERICHNHWPQVLDLPTAAGKTACMDAAIYALADQALLSLEERKAPRRIWFVVDRRIVVDAAYERAKYIEEKLQSADTAPLKQIADRLRKLSGTGRPLVSARLRGGVLHDQGWGRLPSQPAIISSTVDQLGSRLLFRGYGHSSQTASIFAGLAANDSLILLDEAHCSLPFHQTLQTISGYRGEKWAEQPIKTPFAYAILSATPPSEDGVALNLFPGDEREKALKSEVLQKRLQASKIVELHELKNKKSNSDANDPENELLINATKIRVNDYLKSGKKRIAVIVNRVKVAEEIYQVLMNNEQEQSAYPSDRGDAVPERDVILLTGRMRPYDRDQLVGRWEKYLRAAAPEDYGKAICLVSTQCIEVGADFSFDAMITECASLDALKQRFGRLNRMGLPGDSPATIFIRTGDTKEKEDPIYGTALAKTWNLLIEKSTSIDSNRKTVKTIDFGFEQLRETLKNVNNPGQYLAPHLDAPVMYPAYLDLFCQTSPQPKYEPECAMFLHGKGRGVPEVRVLWRCDLPTENINIWKEIVSMCPPVSGEMLTVPLVRLRQWLTNNKNYKALVREDSDLEGSVICEEYDTELQSPPFLLWCGRKNDRTKSSTNVREIQPGDVIVLPVSYGICGLGQVADSSLNDIWEKAYSATGRGSVLRIQNDVLGQKCSPLMTLCQAAQSGEWDKKIIMELLQRTCEYKPEGDAVAVPGWIINALKIFLSSQPNKVRIENYPGKGLLISVCATQKNLLQELDLFADQDDLTSAVLSKDQETVSLDEHTQSVQVAAERLTKLCLPQKFLKTMRDAAFWHDAGKMDERFQLMLHGGDELCLESTILAKSLDIPMSPQRREQLQRRIGLPNRFRHEMLSVHLAEHFSELVSEADFDLVMHLVASHHGYARPFAPVCEDSEFTEISGQLGDCKIQVSIEERQQWPLLHRVDSKIAERFWLLTRRYGWWGLAYLEAVLRLADWYGSACAVELNHPQEVNL